MIVVHPKDPSTKFLHLMYEDIGGVLFFDSISQREQILEAIRNAPKDEYILLLGHGTPHGLLGGFIGDEDAEFLRDRPNLVGIWSYASSYAYKHGLKGFFSGMFTSEWYEALDNDIDAGPEEIEEMCWSFAGMFGDLLRAGYPLATIAADLMNQNNTKTDLTRFNYSRLTYRRTGIEDLPVKEDYWEYGDVFIEDSGIVNKAVDTIKRDINSCLWQGLEVDMGPLAGRVERDCLKQLLRNYQSLEGERHKPSPKELADNLLSSGVTCDKIKPILFGPASYAIRLSGKAYTIARMKNGGTCCMVTGSSPLFAERNLQINVTPHTFYTLMVHMTQRIVPLISPAIEEYVLEVKKKIMVSEIRKAARRGRM